MKHYKKQVNEIHLKANKRLNVSEKDVPVS